MADKNEKTVQQGTMSDKEFYLKLILSLMCIIGCVGMMVSSALAFFVSNAQSTGNVIKAGKFEVEVYAVECGCAGGCSFTACTADQDMHKYNIVPSGTAKGYAKIILDNGVERTEQYTEQLTSPITITVQAMPGTNVIVKSFWGDVNNNVVSRNELISDGAFIFHSISLPPEEEESESEEVSEDSTDADADLTNSEPVEPDAEISEEDNQTQSEPIVEETDTVSEPESAPEENDGGEELE